MRAAVIAYTAKGAALAEKIKNLIPGGAQVYAHESAGVKAKGFSSTSALMKEIFKKYDALIFVGAAGIAVRAVAPHLENKYVDPAVLVSDERGINIISLLSGHAGGANKLCTDIAVGLGANAVITTATDVNNAFAVDLFAKENGLNIVSPSRVKDISSEILRGGKIGIYAETAGYKETVKNICKKYPSDIYETRNSAEAGIIITRAPEKINAEKTDGRRGPFCLTPLELAAGVGCRRGESFEKIRNAVETAAREAGFSLYGVKLIASIDRKSGEPGIKKLADTLRVPFYTYAAEELMRTEGDFEASEFVREHVGADNVCQRSAAAASGGGRCIVPKTIIGGVAVSIYICDVNGGENA